MERDGNPDGVRLLAVTSASSDHSRSVASGDSSVVTPILIFSALVAVCCPFAGGSAVSSEYGVLNDSFHPPWREWIEKVLTQFLLQLGYSSPTESAIMEDLGLSVAQYSVFGSVLNVGAILASLVNGKLTDVFGRKRTMWLCDGCYLVGCLSVAFAKNAWWLDFGRLFSGFGVGITSYVIPVYIAEIAPQTVRGTFTAMYQLMLACGFSFTYFVGTLVSWRALAIIICIPCVLQLFCLFFIPESPRWLARVGREKEFEIALQKLRGSDADVSEELQDIRDYTQAFEQQSRSRIGIFELFHARYFYPLTVGVGLMLLSQFSGINAISCYSSSVVESSGYSGSVASITIAIIQIPISVASMMLTDKAGRRLLLMVSAAGMCLSCFLIGLSFGMKNLGYWQEATPVLVFVGVVAYYTFLCIGMLGLPWVIMSEIFPINVKGNNADPRATAHRAGMLWCSEKILCLMGAIMVCTVFVMMCRVHGKFSTKPETARVSQLDPTAANPAIACPSTEEYRVAVAMQYHGRHEIPKAV
ncbi:hypothetical protein MLD38_023575 [Melastoma candidum]|uniref:Uncharacterized protein n=1 Tax=Melastoma candidum TaxID=119954 RepID=A0ACB9NQ44_9MYRT|nr:hypothetical protein MLD38_023575 [Melastoma candidum]